MSTNRLLWAIRGSNTQKIQLRRAMELHLRVTLELSESYISPNMELHEFTVGATCYSAQLALKRYNLFS